MTAYVAIGIETVDAHPGNAVAVGFVHDVLDLHLARARRRDRPVVVLAEPQDRQVRHGGEVHRYVPFALRGRTVAERAQHRAILTAYLHAGRVRALRGDDLTDRREADRSFRSVVGKLTPARTDREA